MEATPRRCRFSYVLGLPSEPEAPGFPREDAGCIPIQPVVKECGRILALLVGGRLSVSCLNLGERFECLHGAHAIVPGL